MEITYRYRQGRSYAVGAYIDGFIPKAYAEKLYEKWSPDWPKPMQLQGGVKAITCDQILKVDKGEFYKTFGPVVASKVMKAAKANAIK
jgi:hypothetical protein